MKLPLCSPTWRLVRSFLFFLMGVGALARASGSDDLINIVWLAPLQTVDDGVRSSFNASTSMAGLALAVDRVRTEGVMQGMKFK